jgi:hypothetical protein
MQRSCVNCLDGLLQFVFALTLHIKMALVCEPRFDCPKRGFQFGKSEQVSSSSASA